MSFTVVAFSLGFVVQFGMFLVLGSGAWFYNTALFDGLALLFGRGFGCFGGAI